MECDQSLYAPAANASLWLKHTPFLLNAFLSGVEDSTRMVTNADGNVILINFHGVVQLEMAQLLKHFLLFQRTRVCFLVSTVHG